MYDEKYRKNPASARTDLNKLTMTMTMTFQPCPPAPKNSHDVMLPCPFRRHPPPTHTLADLVAGFEGGGATCQGVPCLGTHKAKISTDLANYFGGWDQIHFRKNVRLEVTSSFGVILGFGIKFCNLFRTKIAFLATAMTCNNSYR